MPIGLGHMTDELSFCALLRFIKKRQMAGEKGVAVVGNKGPEAIRRDYLRNLDWIGNLECAGNVHIKKCFRRSA